MALPASLLHHVEQHGCFTGCYSCEFQGHICLDPNQRPQGAVFVSCHDCLSFKIGVLQALLPAQMNQNQLADLLTRHNRNLRGFGLTVSGYHAKGPGFWLSAAYYPKGGLFLLDGNRSRPLGQDLDLLMLAFKHQVIAPPDPRMTDPKLFQVQDIYVHFGGQPAPVASKQEMLAAPQCRTQPTKGFERITLAEFQPLAVRAAPATKVVPAAQAPTKGPVLVQSAAPKKLKLGDICPVCHAEVKARPLLQGTYVGCLC